MKCYASLRLKGSFRYVSTENKMLCFKKYSFIEYLYLYSVGKIKNEEPLVRSRKLAQICFCFNLV